MGAAFGKINEEMPAHKVVYEGEGFEVWKYPTSVAAVVRAGDIQGEEPLTDGKFTSKAFWALAGYIGVLSEPENTKDGHTQKVAMTAPVMMQPPSQKKSPGESIAMTAPVLLGPPSSGESMAFLLPSKYETVEDAPRPTNAAVNIELMPVRYEAVLGFSGNLDMKNPVQIEKKAAELLELMKKDGLEPSGSYTVAGYNAPFVLPWLKRNEIHFPVDSNAKFTES